MKVLDKGFVRYSDVLGSDLAVVNSARVSYGGQSTQLSDKDKKLIEYLAKNKHTSPFRHCFITFHVKAPEFVARQWYKHVVGCNFSMGDAASHGWNEISGRYVEYDPDFYVPESLRAQSTDSKQASVESNEMPSSDIVKNSIDESYKVYKSLLEAGVAKEQARMILPFSTYTEFYWTASLQAIAHFCKLRDHSHAQYEIKEYALQVSEITNTHFPYAFPSLLRSI
jgi:thymidylate synthase (FAD)